jgi:hypothetical protein
LIGLGIMLVLAGVAFLVLNKIGVLGKLPGDIHVRKENLEFSFPLTTCILVSAALSVLFTVFFKWFRK